jgi:hypothetical protein
MVQSLAGAIITEPCPGQEKQRTPSFLDRLEKKIMTDPQKIEIMHLVDVIVKIVSFEF